MTVHPSRAREVEDLASDVITGAPLRASWDPHMEALANFGINPLDRSHALALLAAIRVREHHETRGEVLRSSHAEILELPWIRVHVSAKKI
jgi:hypothetical protein